MIAFPNAKINLGLYITSKRDDGFHDLETVFYPIPLYDVLEIIEDRAAFSCSVSGRPVDTKGGENLCVKAFRLLRKDFPQIPDIHIYLHKAIPMGAGLGGGSADAAFTLALLNDKFQLDISKEQLSLYALQLGSDCPFFIYNKPCIARGRGEILEAVGVDLSDYYFVLINPGIHINTAWAFKQLQPKTVSFSLKEAIAQPAEAWKEILHNDFEQVVFKQYPAIKDIKELLYKNGAVYASMSGSGSSVYGLFKENTEEGDFGFDRNYFVFRSKL